ncbi:glycine cleavage system protein GcvH [Streptomyces sp. NPDC001537]
MTPTPQPPLKDARTTAVPRHLRCTWDHEWLVVDEGNASVGITAFAAEALGDVVHLRLPEAGSHVEAGENCGEIRSLTAVSEPYAPASGEVLEGNPALADTPGVVNPRTTPPRSTPSWSADRPVVRHRRPEGPGRGPG